MATVDVDVGRKRRLPLWMMGVTVSDELGKSGNKDQNGMSLEEQSLFQTTCQPKAKPAKRLKKITLNKNEREDSEMGSSCLVGCETRQRTTESSRQGLGPSNSITSTNESNVPIKKSRAGCGGERRNVQKRTAPKKQKLKGYGPESSDQIEAMSTIEGCGGEKRCVRKRAFPKKQKLKVCGPESIDEIEATSPTEGGQDGVELTMEDLMSMAEENVKADQDKECQQSATTEPKSKTQLPNMYMFSVNKSVGCVQANDSDRQKRTYAMERISPDLSITRQKEKDTSASEDVAIYTSRTGDPAQDMLDLFLGPLLKKPQIEEKKFDLTAEEMAFVCNYNKPIMSQASVEAAAPLMKKKSSLKEKVAMFLD